MVYPNIRPVKREGRVKRSPKRKFSLRVHDNTMLDFEETRYFPTAHIVRTEDDKLVYNVSLWIDSPINYRNVTTSYQVQVVTRLRQEGLKMAPVFKHDSS